MIRLKKRQSVYGTFYCIFVFFTVVLNAAGYSLLCNLLYLPFFAVSAAFILRHKLTLYTQDILLLLFCLVTAVSAFGGGFQPEGVRACYSIVSLCSMVILPAKVFGKEDRAHVERAYVAGALVLGLWAFTAFVRAPDTRLGDGIAANSINVGITLAFCSMFLMRDMVRYGIRKYGLLYAVCMLLLLLTGSRGPLVIAGLASALIFASEKNAGQGGRPYRTGGRIINTNTKRKAGIVAAAVMALFLAFSTGFARKYLWRFQEFFQAVGARQSGPASGSTGVRMYLKILGFREFMKRPLWGHGAGAAKAFLSGSYFHDNFIQTAYETGIIGLAGYYIPHVRCFILLLRRKNYFPAILAAMLLLDGVFDVVGHSKIFYIIFSICNLYLYPQTKKISGRAGVCGHIRAINPATTGYCGYQPDGIQTGGNG